MPEPERRDADLAALVRDAVTLQQAGQENVVITSEVPQGKLMMEIDQTMITQALTNLIKNAGEATETFIENNRGERGYQGRVHIELRNLTDAAEITISDNGNGLPEDRARLFEPYVTTRDSGTGLGLPIVKKIIEEHGGTLELTDAQEFENCSHKGALACIRLPHATAKENPARVRQGEGDKTEKVRAS